MESFDDQPLVPFIPPGARDEPEITVHREEQDDEDDEEDELYQTNVSNRLYELKTYRFRPSKNTWKHVPSNHNADGKPSPTSVQIITWNLDFSSPRAAERLTAALRHIETDVLGCKDGVDPAPCCILLQEVNANVVEVLHDNMWVRRHFMMTPFSTSKWPADAQYGNVTLVSRSLTIVRSQILHFGYTAMHRTGVAVYIKLRAPDPDPRDVVICVVNTHLESLSQGAVARPKQLSLLLRFLTQDKVQGGVIAGDMNPVSSYDATIPGNLGLRDAWKKSDNDESGFTWGYQGQTHYPPARFDKVLYLPRRGYKVDEPQVIGVGVKEPSESEWVSDHYGLRTTLRMIR